MVGLEFKPCPAAPGSATKWTMVSNFLPCHASSLTCKFMQNLLMDRFFRKYHLTVQDQHVINSTLVVTNSLNMKVAVTANQYTLTRGEGNRLRWWLREVRIHAEKCSPIKVTTLSEEVFRLGHDRFFPSQPISQHMSSSVRDEISQKWSSPFWSNCRLKVDWLWLANLFIRIKEYSHYLRFYFEGKTKFGFRGDCSLSCVVPDCLPHSKNQRVINKMDDG